MVTSSTKVGIVAFWTLGITDRKQLVESMEAAGLIRFIPKPPTPAVALFAALQEVYPNHLVRNLSVPGFEVVEEIKGDERNTYNSVITAKLNKKTGELTLTGGGSYRHIQNAYDNQRELLQPGAVAGMLAKIAREAMGATILRPTGGVYWFPESKLATWQAVAAAVEGAGDKNRIYAIKHDLDVDSIRAVRDCLMAEVTAEAARLSEDVFSNRLGKNALEGRKAEAMAMLEKVKAYELILGEGLDALRTQIGEVQGAAASAILTLATGTANANAA